MAGIIETLLLGGAVGKLVHGARRHNRLTESIRQGHNSDTSWFFPERPVNRPSQPARAESTLAEMFSPKRTANGVPHYGRDGVVTEREGFFTRRRHGR